MQEAFKIFNFNFFVWGGHTCCAQDLLLALHLEIIPSGIWGTICGVGDGSWVGFVQGKLPTSCIMALPLERGFKQLITR